MVYGDSFDRWKEKAKDARKNDESLLFGILTKETSKLKKNGNFEMIKNFRNYYFSIFYLS